MPEKRTVLFVSDGTGITVQMLGHSLLTQFEGLEVNEVTLPFIDSLDKAEAECMPRIREGDELDVAWEPFEERWEIRHERPVARADDEERRYCQFA